MLNDPAELTCGHDVMMHALAVEAGHPDGLNGFERSRRRLRQTIKHIRARKLTPQQLYELHVYAHEEHFRQSRQEQAGPWHWPDAASAVQTATALLVAKTYRPENVRDFGVFVHLLRSGHVGLYLNDRDFARLENRLRANLHNLLMGLPIDMRSPRPRRDKSVAPKAVTARPSRSIASHATA